MGWTVVPWTADSASRYSAGDLKALYSDAFEELAASSPTISRFVQKAAASLDPSRFARFFVAVDSRDQLVGCVAVSMGGGATGGGGGTAASAYTPHYYMHISAGEQAASGGGLGWVTRDLRIFSRAGKGWERDGFRFVLDPTTNKGTHCRFGMKGIVAGAHYDGKRNMVAMLKGSKRYVLAPPAACAHLDLLPRGHPSARHSALDWRDDPAANVAKHPAFGAARALQTVVRAGEVLYIPSYWMHMPVSLETSVQCNTRSGNAREGRDEIAKCGFYKGGGGGAPRRRGRG